MASPSLGFVAPPVVLFLRGPPKIWCSRRSGVSGAILGVDGVDGQSGSAGRLASAGWRRAEGRSALRDCPGTQSIFGVNGAVMVGQLEADADIRPSLGTVPSARPASRWYAVHCQPNRERAAAAHLRNQDYDVFLPLQRKTRRHARKIDRVLRPFFPGYLFLQLDLALDRWRPINGTFGVVRLVMQGDRPAPAPLGVVEGLKECCDENGVLEWLPMLVPGQPVRITEGPFAELVGELERLDGAGRVRVLLNFMGGEVPTWLPRSSVVSATSLV